MKTMNAFALGAIVLLALGVGGWWGRASAPVAMPASDSATPAPKAERRVLYYRNPMGLPDTSPVPKKDSMGMDYIAVYDGEVTAEPGTVVLPPEKVQKLGVRTALATRERLSASVRASARVEIDETRQFVIAPRFEGWIERLHANQTGMAVRRGQPLMTLYSPALLAAQEEYRIADEAARRLAEVDPSSAAAMRQLRDAAQARLRNWQVSGARLGHGGDAARLALTAPADAVVVEKPVVEGDRFEAGQTVLRLADLSRVWVVAEVPVSQASGLAVGQPAQFSAPNLPSETREAKIDFLQPVVDVDSRTVAVRLVLPNPDGMLRPGLFGEVLLQGPPDAEAVVVPRSAVIDSGSRQIVLVQLAEGRFEPRAVRLGRRAGDRVAVLDGVEEGEQVVVAANFLIDAESNLSSALQGLAPASAAEHDHDSDTAAPDADRAEPGHEHGTAEEPGDEPAKPDPHAGHAGHGGEH
jgi:membrane fusion protein, copper/silver efflux system